MTHADSIVEALLFPAPLQSNIDMLRNQFQGVDQITNPMQLQFIRQAQVMFEQNYNAQAMQERQEIINAHKGIGYAYQTSVLALLDIDDIQGSSELMQNYIMACPQVHELYIKQRIEGFYTTYVDPTPDAPLWTNPFYQAACDGVAIDSENSCVVTHFFSDNLQQLSLVDQINIHATWDAVRAHLGGEYDPTSATNQTL